MPEVTATNAVCLSCASAGVDKADCVILAANGVCTFSDVVFLFSDGILEERFRESGVSQQHAATCNHALKQRSKHQTRTMGVWRAVQHPVEHKLEQCTLIRSCDLTEVIFLRKKKKKKEKKRELSKTQHKYITLCAFFLDKWKLY